jgi:hypothetical protein
VRFWRASRDGRPVPALSDARARCVVVAAWVDGELPAIGSRAEGARDARMTRSPR